MVCFENLKKPIKLVMASVLQPDSTSYKDYMRNKKQADKHSPKFMRSHGSLSLTHSLSVSLPTYLFVACKSTKNGRFQQNIFFCLSSDWTRGRGGGRELQWHSE